MNIKIFKIYIIFITFVSLCWGAFHGNDDCEKIRNYLTEEVVKNYKDILKICSMTNNKVTSM